MLPGLRGQEGNAVAETGPGTCRACLSTWLLPSVLWSCDAWRSLALTEGDDFCGNKCEIHVLIEAA